MIKEDEITASGYIECTSNNFKIDGILVACPTGIKFEEHTLSRSWNSASGIQHKTNYRLRRKVIWVYNVIGKESLQKIYNILNDKRIKTGKTRFTIHTDYIDGDTDMIVEWGTPFKLENIEGRSNLFNLEFEFIEPIGIKLPTAEQ